MAIQTPMHRQRCSLAGQLHLVDRAMAGRTADALGDMDRMIEVDVARQLVDALPCNWLVLGKARANRRQHLGVGPDLGVAGHAGFRRRQSGETRSLDGSVAVAAIEAQSANMVFV